MLAAYGYYAAEMSGLRGRSSSSLNEQEQDGSWFGRWGVNYLYGTFLAFFVGWKRVGLLDPYEPAVQNAAEWIRMVQNGRRRLG